MSIEILKSPAGAFAEELRYVYSKPENSDLPMVITPAIFRELHYKLTDMNRTYIFLGFGETKPLIIPERTRFLKPVWIVDSIYRSASGVVFEEDVYFIESKFRLPISRTSTAGKESGGLFEKLKHFDTASWLDYKREKGRTSAFRNSIVKLHPVDELEESPLEAALVDLMSALPVLNFDRYFTECMPKNEFVYKPTEGTYLIEGDIVVNGPYQYESDNKIVFYGEVQCFDLFGGIFTSDTEQRVKLCGFDARIEVRSFWNYEKSNN